MTNLKVSKLIENYKVISSFFRVREEKMGKGGDGDSSVSGALAAFGHMPGFWDNTSGCDVRKAQGLGTL